MRRAPRSSGRPLQSVSCVPPKPRGGAGEGAAAPPSPGASFYLRRTTTANPTLEAKGQENWDELGHPGLHEPCMRAAREDGPAPFPGGHRA